MYVIQIRAGKGPSGLYMTINDGMVHIGSDFFHLINYAGELIRDERFDYHNDLNKRIKAADKQDAIKKRLLNKKINKKIKHKEHY